MTKTLTENKWFYTENGIKDASWNIVLKSEVLAPVPSYDEINRLQEQLKEANAIIDLYFPKDKKINAVCVKPINDYREKWGAK